MANRTSVSVFCRNTDANLIGHHFEDETQDHLPGVTLFNDGEFTPDFAEINAAGIPFYGMHGSYSGDYTAYVVAFDGSTYMDHSCDEDGDISITGLLEDAGDPADYRIGEGTAEFIRHYRKCRALVHSPDTATLLPAEFRLASVPTSMVIHEMQVPQDLIAFALRFYGRPASRVMGQFYAGEDILFHLEDLSEDFDALRADGWPGRFLEAAQDAAAQGADYLRLVS